MSLVEKFMSVVENRLDPILGRVTEKHLRKFDDAAARIIDEGTSRNESIASNQSTIKFIPYSDSRKSITKTSLSTKRKGKRTITQLSTKTKTKGHTSDVSTSDAPTTLEDATSVSMYPKQLQQFKKQREEKELISDVNDVQSSVAETSDTLTDLTGALVEKEKQDSKRHQDQMKAIKDVSSDKEKKNKSFFRKLLDAVLIGGLVWLFKDAIWAGSKSLWQQFKESDFVQNFLTFFQTNYPKTYDNILKFVEKVKEFSKKVVEIWEESIQPFIDQTGKWITETALPWVKEFLTKTLPDLITNYIKPFFTETLPNFINKTLPSWKDTFVNVITAIKDKPDQALDNLKSLVPLGTEGIKGGDSYWSQDEIDKLYEFAPKSTIQMLLAHERAYRNRYPGRLAIQDRTEGATWDINGVKFYMSPVEGAEILSYQGISRNGAIIDYLAGKASNLLHPEYKEKNLDLIFEQNPNLKISNWDSELTRGMSNFERVQYNLERERLQQLGETPLWKSFPPTGNNSPEMDSFNEAMFNLRNSDPNNPFDEYGFPKRSQSSGNIQINNTPTTISYEIHNTQDIPNGGVNM